MYLQPKLKPQAQRNNDFIYMKKIILTLTYFLFITTTFAQNLFTYGKHAVTKEEFVRAFNKNPVVDKSRGKALREYLNLYINFKLKVQAAYDVLRKAEERRSESAGEQA